MSQEQMNVDSLDRFDPIFIVGPERCGTTLMSALLGRHSAVAATPEMHFLYDGAMAKTPRRHQTHDLLLERWWASERAGDFKLERDALRRRFEGYPPTYPCLLRSLLEEYGQGEGKSRSAEKSPHHIFHASTIFDWFPEARMVGIVRDGRDAVLSLMKARWAHYNMRLHSIVWRHVVKESLALKQRFPDRYMQIRFEDVLQEPVKTLGQIMKFVDLDFEPAQLDPSQATGVVPDWEREWKGKVDQQLDASRVYAWKQTTTDEERWLMNSIMGPYLRRLDYDDSGLEGCPAARYLRMTTKNRIDYCLQHRAIHPWLKKARAHTTGPRD
jgi:hypothetical protein